MRLAHQAALENPKHIRAYAIDATEFPQMSEQYAVSAVPKTVINESVDFLGRVPEGQFLGHLLRAVGG